MKTTVAAWYVVWACSGCGEEAAHGDGDTSVGDTAASTDVIAPDASPDENTPETATAPPLCSTEGLVDRWTLEDLASDGPFLAGYVELTVFDPSRKTAAHGLVPEADGRAIGVRVHYPAEEGLLGPLTPPLLAPPARSQGPYPLLVHSHGFSSNKDELAYAARWLATRGWVVASVEFPLTSLGTLGGPQLLDVVNQPEDVTAALDELMRRAMTAGELLDGMIDDDRVALSGVSLGGLTTLLATYHRDLHDPRVKAAIDIAGPTAFLSPTFYGFVSLPVLLLYGDADAIVDHAAHALPARVRAPAGSRLMTLAAASHTAFADAAALFEALDHPDSLGCDAIAGQLPEGGFLDELADPEVGVIDVEMPAPCTLDPLPHAMRPSRQHLLTRLAVYAWLELHLASDAATRAAACELLVSTLATQPDVELE